MCFISFPHHYLHREELSSTVLDYIYWFFQGTNMNKWSRENVHAVQYVHIIPKFDTSTRKLFLSTNYWRFIATRTEHKLSVF